MARASGYCVSAQRIDAGQLNSEHPAEYFHGLCRGTSLSPSGLLFCLCSCHSWGGERAAQIIEAEVAADDAISAAPKRARRAGKQALSRGLEQSNSADLPMPEEGRIMTKRWKERAGDYLLTHGQVEWDVTGLLDDRIATLRRQIRTAASSAGLQLKKIYVKNNKLVATVSR
jgi:hypothetical protein